MDEVEAHLGYAFHDRALLDARIVPDLVVGTSIGAVNGALLAADPTRAGVIP